jgi:hypothetical protein
MMLRRFRSFANYRFNFGMAIGASLENLIDWIGMRSVRQAEYRSAMVSDLLIFCRAGLCLQANSAPSLVINETTHIPASFYRARIEISWPEWIEVIEARPQGPLRDRLMSGEGKFVQKELQRGVLSDALARGEVVEGILLVKGSHVRLR